MSTSVTGSSQKNWRSKRLSSRNATISKSPSRGTVDAESESLKDNQPLTKRQKTDMYAPDKPKTSRKSRRGKLRDLPEMPLDILYEIFGHLFPLDVLRLSRTTKASRDLLMRRSALFIWHSAFSNLPVTPPSCPEDLNLPRWTSLLFETHCSVCLFRCMLLSSRLSLRILRQFCSKHSVLKIFWMFRVRCCKRCLKSPSG